ncbi:MAG: acyltransferase family protein [Dysgonomonas sp.]
MGYSSEMNKATGNRYNIIDLLKGICCFAVVMLHFPAKISHEFLILQAMLGRCAVPIFILLSGYLLGLKVQPEFSKSLRQARKLFVWSIAMELISLVFKSIYGAAVYGDSIFALADEVSIQRLVHLLIFNRPFFVGLVWYLYAAAYATIVFAVFLRWGKTKILLYISPILLLAYYVFGRYSEPIFGTEAPSWLASNWLLIALPMYTIGYYIAKTDFSKIKVVNLKIVMGISVFLLYVEASTFFELVGGGRNNYVGNLVLSVLVILCFVKPQVCVKDNILITIGKRYSLYIYLFQFIARDLVQLVKLKTVNFEYFNILLSKTLPFAIFTVSFLIALLVYKVVDCRKKCMVAEL